MLKTGIKAPDFELPDQNGKTHKLADYRGKPPIIRRKCSMRWGNEDMP